MSVVLILFALFFIGAALFKRGAALQLEDLASLLIFLAIGVGILVSTLRKRRKQPDYGPTMVELFESPVVPEGRLVGRAVTGLPQQELPREGFVVRLSYLESRGDDETHSTSRLWSDQQRVSAWRPRSMNPPSSFPSLSIFHGTLRPGGMNAETERTGSFLSMPICQRALFLTL